MKSQIKINALRGLLTCLVLTTVWVTQAAEALPFWKKPPTTLAGVKLAPASVEISSQPDLTHLLLTFHFNATNGTADFVPTNPLILPLVTKDKGDPYRVILTGLAKGAEPYTDRAYTITELPDRFASLTLLQTKMGHKNIVDARYAIELTVSRPVYLFLALDERLLGTFEKFGTPAWMQEFAPTGDKIATDDPLMKASNVSYRVFVKQFPKGQIALGPCCAEPYQNGMYFAFLAGSR